MSLKAGCLMSDPDTKFAERMEVRDILAREDTERPNAEALAKRFHETYERLAPAYGYKTREASAVPWDDVPKTNKDLMIAVCREIQGDVLDTEQERER